jgi:histidinol dehydrogenase
MTMNGLELPRVSLAGLGGAARAAITRRSVLPDRAVREGAAAIVADVRDRGDDALRSAAARYGGGLATGDLAVDRRQIAAGLSRLDVTTRTALQRAIDAIEACHRPQLPVESSVEAVAGVTVTRRWRPLRRVGLYVPGGRAPYPSSLLMAAIPARVAGVAEIVAATPAGPDGVVADIVLGAAALAGVSEMYAVGGAQAVGALAYGTETITPVDKIVGPGNPWVTAAKLTVFGDVAIDLPAGPSEALVIADGRTPARFVAADMLCQAEHGPESPVVLVVTDPASIGPILTEIERLLPRLERRQIIEKALTDHSLVVVAANLEDAITFANEYAPEHLTVHTDNADAVADRITAAGSVFVGDWAPESAGDYATGANHVLPTGGLARAQGPLGVEDFGSWQQVQHISRSGLEKLRPTIAALATAEGLTAHRLAADVRFESEEAL